MSSVEFHKFRENIKNINDYTDQKEKIFDNFIDQGLPNKRNESWKYFDLVSKSKKYIKNDISNSEIIVEDLEEKNIFMIMRIIIYPSKIILSHVISLKVSLLWI